MGSTRREYLGVAMGIAGTVWGATAAGAALPQACGMLRGQRTFVPMILEAQRKAGS